MPTVLSHVYEVLRRQNQAAVEKNQNKGAFWGVEGWRGSMKETSGIAFTFCTLIRTWVIEICGFPRKKQIHASYCKFYF